MTFWKQASFSEQTKQISSHIATTLKPLGYRKRRNGFNRRLDNGLIHQISLFTVGAYSIDHGKFYIHAGCYVPEAELFLKNAQNPKWVIDAICTIRGSFPDTQQDGHAYLSICKIAADPEQADPYLSRALASLSHFETYDQILNAAVYAPPFDFSRPPLALVQACILIDRKDLSGATAILEMYLAGCEAEPQPHRGHIDFVASWAKSNGLSIEF